MHDDVWPGGATCSLPAGNGITPDTRPERLRALLRGGVFLRRDAGQGFGRWAFDDFSELTELWTARKLL